MINCSGHFAVQLMQWSQSFSLDDIVTCLSPQHMINNSIINIYLNSLLCLCCGTAHGMIAFIVSWKHYEMSATTTQSNYSLINNSIINIELNNLLCLCHSTTHEIITFVDSWLHYKMSATTNHSHYSLVYLSIIDIEN